MEKKKGESGGRKRKEKNEKPKEKIDFLISLILI